MPLLTDEHRSWIGHAEPPVTVHVSRRDIVKYAVATGQTQRKYLDGDEAPPMFVFNLFTPINGLDRLASDGLSMDRGSGPELPLERTMAGGTELRVSRPIRAGDTLVATRRIRDIYEKEGLFARAREMFDRLWADLPAG